MASRIVWGWLNDLAVLLVGLLLVAPPRGARIRCLRKSCRHFKFGLPRVACQAGAWSRRNRWRHRCQAGAWRRRSRWRHHCQAYLPSVGSLPIL